MDKFGSAGNSTLVDHAVNGSLQPLEAGSRQTITFVLKEDGAKTYFIAMRATDKNGLTSQASNIVSVQFTTTIEPESGLSKQALFGIIVGCIFGVLLIVLIIYLIAKKKYCSYTKASTKSDIRP